MKKSIALITISLLFTALAIATGEKDMTPAIIPLIIGIYQLFNKEVLQ